MYSKDSSEDSSFVLSPPTPARYFCRGQLFLMRGAAAEQTATQQRDVLQTIQVEGIAGHVAQRHAAAYWEVAFVHQASTASGNLFTDTS